MRTKKDVKEAPEGTPQPRVFAYVPFANGALGKGETKGLRENGLHQGETKELAGARAKKR